MAENLQQRGVKNYEHRRSYPSLSPTDINGNLAIDLNENKIDAFTMKWSLLKLRTVN